MIKASYEELLERIAKLSGLSKEEVEKRVEAKRARLSGLISKEGAIQVVAAELGIKFENIKLKIADLLAGMKRVNVIGKVVRIFPIKQFERNGRTYKIVSFLLADDSDIIRVVLWDTSHIALVENGKIKEGITVEITNANVRGSETTKELHLTSYSNIELSNVVLENVKEKQEIKQTQIARLNANDRVKIRAVVVHVFDPFYFSICPECKKRVNTVCDVHNKALHRVLLSLIVDDGTANIRVLCFTKPTLELFSINADTPEQESEQVKMLQNKTTDEIKDELLGKEFVFEGRVRKNTQLNVLEFIANKITVVDPSQLVGELAKM